MKTVLLLGAGLTRATKPVGSLARRPPLDSDFFNIARAVDSVESERIRNSLEEFVGEYSESLLCSLETATTYLYLKALDSKAGEPSHVGFLRLLVLLNKVLAETTNTIKTGPASLAYRFILSELTHCVDPVELTVITFNYDLLIERVLQEISARRSQAIFAFPGCYRLNGLVKSKIIRVDGDGSFSSNNLNHEGVSVLKLHGSLNWQSKHVSDRPTPSALFNRDREIYIANSPMIGTNLSFRQAKRAAYMKPVIVPPVSGKRSMMHSELLPVWSAAAKALREAERVVIAGYSCPPLDIEARILLSENLRRNPSKRVYVIDPNSESAAKFSRICGVDHLTIYDSVNDWIRDAQ